jgi:uncharacterized protein (TIGR00369 family)
MDVQEDGYCFVCGPENPVGIKAEFTLDPEAKSARCELTLPREFQGWEKVVHGGILSTLLDEAAIYACRTCGEGFVTAELQVRFRKPVAVGVPIVVSSRVVKEKRKILEVESRLEQDGKVCAEASARVFRLA